MRSRSAWSICNAASRSPGFVSAASTPLVSNSSWPEHWIRSWTAISACWLHRLPERSGGNAFFLGELWRHLLHHGVVVADDDRWVVRRDLASVGAPDSVRDVVAGRMARLSRRARRPLELAAVAGQRVESRVLSLAAEMPATMCGAGLDELVDNGFLVSVGGHLLTYQFIHALVRDTVEEVLSPSTQASLHLRIAEALEQIYEADRRSVFAELARHFGAAAASAASSAASVTAGLPRTRPS